MCRRRNYRQTLIKRQTQNQLFHILILILLIPHFEPGFIDSEIAIMDMVFNAGRVLSAIFILVYVYAVEKTISIAMILFGMLQSWYLINTLFQSGLSKQIIINTGSLVIGCLIIDCFAKRNTADLVHGMLIMYEILVYCNLITIVIFPEGLYSTEFQWENWFIGFRNSFTFTFVPAIAVSLIWSKYTGRYMRSLVMIAACLLSAILSRSATCLVVTVFMVGVYISHLYKVKAFNSITATVIYLFINITIVMLNLQVYLTSWFDRLGRNTTFTGRTFIWARTIKAILDKPFIGYGQQNINIRIAMVPEAYGATHAHNFILEQAYLGGVIQLVLVIAFFSIILIKMYQERKAETTRVLCLALLCVYLIYTVESALTLQIFSFLFLCYYSRQISDMCKQGVCKMKE